MTLPSYQLLVIDCQTGNPLAALDSRSFWDMRYSRSLNGIGRIAITMPGDTPYRAALSGVDNLIEVYRTDPSSTTRQLMLEETYLLRIAHRFREENDERFVVGGVSLNHLMRRRIIDPASDPTAAGGYSTKAGAADAVIYAYCNEQMGPGGLVPERRFPNLTLTPVVGNGLPVGARLRFENLYEEMLKLASRGYTDFQITRAAGNNLVLTIGIIGEDRTLDTNYPWNSWVSMDPHRGNLQRPSYRVDRTDEKNYVYALGQGQGVSRQVYNLVGDSAADSPWNRIEFTSDVRQAEKNDAQTLPTAARAAIKENLPLVEFSFEPTGIDPGNTYRLDWDLGDRMTAIWDEAQQDVRVTEIEVSADGGAGETLKVTVVRYDS